MEKNSFWQTKLSMDQRTIWQNSVWQTSKPNEGPAILENMLAIHHGLFEIQNDLSVRELLCKCTKIPSRELKPNSETEMGA